MRDPSLTSFNDVAKVVLCCLDLIGLEEDFSIKGFEGIGDMTGLSFAHAAQMTPPTIKKLSILTQVFIYFT